MKVLFAADGSSYTKKALAFLVTHTPLLEGGEVVVLNCQLTMPPRVRALVGAEMVEEYYREETARVLGPVGEFLRRHALPHRLLSEVGPPDAHILTAAQREGAHMIVMGTHGHGLLGRMLMGSVAQRVVAGAEVPVLLVK